MQRKTKVILLGVVTALVLVLPLAAQEAAKNIGSLSSETNYVTNTLFKSDVDNFMTVDRWSRVNFDKGFAFISGGTYNLPGAGGTKGKLGLGYATKLGKLYFGTWYQGNIVEVTNPGQTEKTIEEITYDHAAGSKVTQTVKTTAYQSSWINSANQIQLVLGIANQGIKLGFYESLAQNKQEGNTARPTVVTDNKNGEIKYTGTVDKYAETKGYLRPYIGWGTDVTVSPKLKLRPYIDFAVEIYNEKLIDEYSNYTENNGKEQDKETFLGKGHSKGYVAPQPTVGIKFDSPTKKGASSTFIMQYALDLQLYNNSAETAGFSDKEIKGTVGWSNKAKTVTNNGDHTVTATNITLDFDEKKWAAHAITPRWMISGSPAAGLSLGFIVSAPVTITPSSSKTYTEQHVLSSSAYETDASSNTSTSTVTRTNGQQRSDTVTNFQLTGQVGAQYKLVPDRFTINAGVTATPINLTHTVNKTKGYIVDYVTTTTEKDSTGKVTNTSTDQQGNYPRTNSTAATNSWAGFNGGISGGFTLNFTPKIALDMSVNSQGNNFRLHLEDVRVCLSLKY